VICKVDSILVAFEAEGVAPRREDASLYGGCTGLPQGFHQEGCQGLSAVHDGSCEIP
jgi:hypothetical protein